MRGIDISNWQAGIRPSDLDIDFCICKATEGTWFTDKYCDGFISDCIDHAIPWGFYHFATSENQIKQAEYFVDECKNYFGHGIPVLDFEIWAEINDPVKFCEQFLERVHELTNVWPMLYISASRCGIFEDSWIAAKCGLWVASYPYALNTWPSESAKINYNIYPWSFAAIWQFSRSLKLKGYSGNLDGDIAYMDLKGWNKYAACEKANSNTGSTVHNATSEQPSGISGNAHMGKTCEEIAQEVLQGKWGVGEERKKRIDAAFVPGTYEHVQSIINEWMV